MVWTVGLPCANKGVFKGGGFRGFNPPPEMGGGGGGCYPLTYLWELRYFQGGLRNFRGGGVENIFFCGGGGVEKFSGEGD